MSTVVFSIIDDPAHGIQLLSPKVRGSGNVKNAEIEVKGLADRPELTEFVKQTVAPQFTAAIPASDDYNDADYDQWDAAVVVAKKAVREYA